MIRAAIALTMAFAAPAHAVLACCLIHRAPASTDGGAHHAAGHAAATPDTRGGVAVRAEPQPDPGGRPCPALAARSSVALRAPDGRPAPPVLDGPAVAALAAPLHRTWARSGSGLDLHTARVVPPPSTPLRI